MAACDDCLNGDLTTITFSGSGFTANYLLIGGPEITREIIDATTLGLETCRAKCPGDKIDYGSITLRFCHDSSQQPPYDGASETVVVTFPPKPTETTGGTLTGSGFVNRYKVADSEPDTRMESEAEFTFDCQTSTPVFAPGS